MGATNSKDPNARRSSTKNSHKLHKRRSLSWQIKRHTSTSPLDNPLSQQTHSAPVSPTRSASESLHVKQKTKRSSSKAPSFATNETQLFKHNSIDRIKLDEGKFNVLQTPPKPPSPQLTRRLGPPSAPARRSVGSPITLKQCASMDMDGASCMYDGYPERLARSDQTGREQTRGRSISLSLSQGTGDLFDLQKAVEIEKAKKKRFELLNKLLIDRNVIIDVYDLQFDRKVGEGAYSEVWEGWWNGIHVAIKKLKLMVNDIAFEERFLREVENLRNCNHPNVVMFFGVCLRPPCIVTEFMSGGNLYNFLHQTKLRPTYPLVLKMATDLAVGLSHLHSLTVLHRDLTSLNVLLDDVGNVKISDFGLSREKNQEGSMTMTFGGICNPRWRPPEITKNQGHYSEKVDVYCFGLIAWEILTGEIPFDGLDGPQAAAQVAYTNLRPVIPSDCNQALSELITRCWHDDPKERPEVKMIVAKLREITWSNPVGGVDKGLYPLGRTGSAGPAVGSGPVYSPPYSPEIASINRCASNPLYF